MLNDLAQCLHIALHHHSIGQNGKMGGQTFREDFGLATEMKIKSGAANVRSGRNRFNVETVIA